MKNIQKKQQKLGIDCRMFSSNFTGIGRYTYELVTRLIELNDKSTNPHQIVLFFNNPEFSEFQSASPNVKKVLANCPHYSLSEQLKFFKILKKEKLDLMFFTHFNKPLLYRQPFIVTIHDLTLTFYPGKKMNKLHHRLAYNLLIRNATRRSRAVIAVSENTKNDLQKHLKIPKEKVHVTYLGISPEFKILNSPQDLKNIKSTLKKYKIEKPFLLYTGVWRSHKNLPTMINGFAEAKEKASKNPNLNNLKDLKLLITGKENPHYPEVKQTVKDLKLQDQVIFPGFVSEEELVHLHNAAEAYVIPSFYEGFGIPPLEAMSCGTPVIASNSSCIPEVCGKENALFFDPNNSKELTDQIIKLCSESAESKKIKNSLIEKGLKHVKNFSFTKMAKQTFDVIQENLKN